MKGFGEQSKSKNKKVSSQIPISSKQQLIDQAIKFHMEGNISEAAKYYLSFINQGFKDHRVFSNYGIILKSLGKLKEAELSTRKAIELNPNFADAYSNLGNILWNLRQLQEAELSTRKAIELNPSFANAHLNLGNILKDLGKLKEAELSTRKAIELNPGFANAHLNLGNILKDLGKSHEAEISYRQVIKINPSLATAYSNLGATLQDLGKLHEAEISYKKAIHIKPDFADAQFNFGGLLLDLGKIDDYIKLSKSMLESKSIDDRNKLVFSLSNSIAYLIKGSFAESLFSINRTKKLIDQGKVHSLKDKKDKKYFLSFFLFLSSLYPLIEKNSNTLDLEKIPHFGDSHCLSFVHQTLSLYSNLNQIQPVLIRGGKAWYFAKKENNRWKDSLVQQIKNHNYSDKVFISFGEIDCKKEDNMLTYAIKKDKDILEVCESTVKGYIDYMEGSLSQNYLKRYYFGVPAPTRYTEFLDKLDIKRNEMIKIFNSLLKHEVLSRGSYFLDVYELTSTKDGENNNLYMCDKFHLSPKCLTNLFDNHLYEPDSFRQLTS